MLEQAGEPPAGRDVTLGTRDGQGTWLDGLPPVPAGGPCHVFTDGERYKLSNVGTEGQVATAAANNQSVYANPGAGVQVGLQEPPALRPTTD